MLEKIAGENDIQRSILQRPFCRTILMDELDLRIQMLRRFRVEVHPIFFPSPDRVNEFAPSAAKIKDRTILLNKASKKGSAEFNPDLRSILLQARESQFVFQGELLFCLAFHAS